MADLNVELIRRAMIGGHDVQNVIQTLIAKNPNIKSIELVVRGDEFPDVVIDYVPPPEPDLNFDYNGRLYRKF